MYAREILPSDESGKNSMSMIWLTAVINFSTDDESDDETPCIVAKDTVEENEVSRHSQPFPCHS